MPNGNFIDYNATNPFLDAATRSALGLGNTAQQFLDPNSQIYQQFGSQLQERLNQASPTLSSLLGFQQASGIGLGGGTAIANEQRQAIEARNRATASSGQRDFFLSNLQTGAGLLSQQQQAFQDLAQQRAQRQQYEDSQTTLGEQLGQIGLGVAGTILGGPAGGAIGSFLGSQLFGGNSLYGSLMNPGTSHFNSQTGKVEFR